MKGMKKERDKNDEWTGHYFGALAKLLESLAAQLKDESQKHFLKQICGTLTELQEDYEIVPKKIKK
jgi:hypothetical protein